MAEPAEPDRADTASLQQRARQQEAGGDFDAAIATWRSVVELRPQDDRLIGELGSALLRQGNFAEALAQYRRAIALSAVNCGAHFGAAIALTRLGKIDEAISALQRAIGLDASISQYHSNHGHLQASAGRRDEAIAAFERALTLEPQNVGLQDALARSRLEARGLEAEIAEARASLAPDAAGGHVRLARLLVRGNRYIEAVSSLEAAALIEPASIEISLELANVYKVLGKLDEPFWELSRTLRISPDSANVRLALSRCLEGMGKIDAAAAILEPAPTADEALLRQARRLREIKRGVLLPFVELRYPDARSEVLLVGEPLRTPSPLVHTNLAEFDMKSARHHAETLYVERQRRCPAVRLYRLGAGARLVVAGDDDFTVLQDGAVVAEQVRPNATEADIENAIGRATGEAAFAGECVLIGRYGVRTWGHWLAELLPKIVVVEARHPGRFRYIVPRVLADSAGHRAAMQSLRYYGIDDSRLALASPDTTHAVEALYLVSPVWSPDRMVHPGAMDWMRISGAHGRDAAPGGRNIALLRRGEATRGIFNLAEVEAFLIARGWSVVDIEGLEFQDQVELFRNADAVVCVLGSGLTGLIYAPRGVKVLTLAPDKWSDLFFVALMQERDALLADVRGRSLGDDRETAATAKFEVAVSAIEAGLVALGLSASEPTGQIDAVAGSGRSLQSSPVVVTVEHEAANVGDTINLIPFLLAVAREAGHPVHVRGKFNAAVKELVAGLPISFAEITGFGPRVEYHLDVRQCWDDVGPKGLHMAQGYFLLAGMAAPDMPMTLPFRTEPCPLPPGIVISPFCGGENQVSENHVRVWYVDRWNAVIEALLAADPTGPIYIIGGPNDDPAPFLRGGVVAVMGRKLPEVLDLMQRAKLCITIDTGTSHLAHYGGVKHHVLLYPAANFFCIHTNPRASVIHALPQDITVAMVLDKVRERLRA